MVVGLQSLVGSVSRPGGERQHAVLHHSHSRTPGQGIRPLGYAGPGGALPVFFLDKLPIFLTSVAMATTHLTFPGYLHFKCSASLFAQVPVSCLVFSVLTGKKKQITGYSTYRHGAAEVMTSSKILRLHVVAEVGR
jgi:hypothetical protein